MKEILLCMVNNGNSISPVDFFKLGFDDGKRIAKVYLRLFLKSLPENVKIITYKASNIKLVISRKIINFLKFVIEYLDRYCCLIGHKKGSLYI